MGFAVVVGVVDVDPLVTADVAMDMVLEVLYVCMRETERYAHTHIHTQRVVRARVLTDRRAGTGWHDSLPSSHFGHAPQAPEAHLHLDGQPAGLS